MSKVVLDAMGGDHAPDAILEGALLALSEGIVQPDELILTGPEPLVREFWQRRSAPAVEIVDAPDELAPGDSPVEALKRKARNSVAVGVKLVKDGTAQAFVSAGNTGIVVATATLGLNKLEGIRRAGIACTIEGEHGPFTVIDVGANPQPKPVHLLHYALMGSAYYHDTFGVQKPRVGLLNIGSEDTKGSPLVREASQLLRDCGFINFIGNVEGIDVFTGACDVVVSDGFTGNVFLKVSEGVAEYVLRSIAKLMEAQNVSLPARSEVLGTMKRRCDYSEYGGALLLGVEGIVTICHGRSRGPAICNAIRFAHRALGARVNQHIVAAARSAAASS